LRLSKCNAKIEGLKSKIDNILSQDANLNVKIEKILKSCEKTIEKNFKRFNLKLIDCSKGCGHCCILNIATLEPESERIIDFVNKNFTTNEIFALKKDIIETYNTTSYLTDEERIVLRKRCLFLDESLSCKIYSVRPIMCRAVTSTDRNRCIEAISKTSFGENFTILSNIYIREIYLEAFNKIANFLNINKLDERSADIVFWLKNKIDKIEVK